VNSKKALKMGKFITELTEIASSIASKKGTMAHNLCAIVFDQKTRTIVTIGVNQHFKHRVGFHAIKRMYTFSRHAEIAAMRQLPKWKLKGLSLLVVRIIDNGLGAAKPCVKCEEVIKKCGIIRCYYTNDEGKVVKTSYAKS